MAKRKAKATETVEEVLNIPVSFGGVSIGDGTARIGVTIDRDNLDISEADENLCGRRLAGRVVVTSGGEDATQKHLFEGTKHELASTFDVKGFRVSPKLIAAGLTFALVGLHVEELAFFAKKSGRLVVSGVEALPVESDDDSDSEE